MTEWNSLYNTMYGHQKIGVGLKTVYEINPRPWLVRILNSFLWFNLLAIKTFTFEAAKSLAFSSFWGSFISSGILLFSNLASISTQFGSFDLLKGSASEPGKFKNFIC